MYYSNGYCTKNIFPASPLLEAVLGYFLVCLVIFFIYFSKIVWPLMKICAYILNNTLMFVRLKIFIKGIALCFVLFWVLFFLRWRRAHFQYFSLSWENSGMFHEILQKYSWYHSGNHTKNNVTCCLYFARLFWIMLGLIFAHYTVLLVLRNPKYSPDVLYRSCGH